MFFTLLPLFIGIGLNIYAVPKVKQIAESRMKHPYRPLIDVVHTHFPKFPTNLPDIYLFFNFLFMIFDYSSLVNVERHLLTLGICLIIRSGTVFLTIFPTCMKKPQTTSNPNMYESLFLSTHDLMFSGHSLFFIFMGQISRNWVVQILGPFSLVLARQHYTIDVCVSGLVYYTIYTNLKDLL